MSHGVTDADERRLASDIWFSEMFIWPLISWTFGR